jgi:NAD(P)-dependent dehydrogenase (short-subunit alcohol dehydrogenase family)
MGCPAAYSASKGGVLALTKYLAVYWAPKGVRVNAISPHGVYNRHEETFVKNFSKKSPIGRMSRADEVVGAMLFLASEASSYVTGHDLMVDGGWTAW